MKYYRFTNEDECHNGFQYKTGLNIDFRPFDPAQVCRGGLFFFEHDQLFSIPAHINPFSGGPLVWVREVTLPADAQVVRMHGKMKADKFVLGERRRITLQWLCEEFSLSEIEPFFSASPYELSNFAFVESLKAGDVMKCARAFSFSAELCRTIMHRYVHQEHERY